MNVRPGPYIHTWQQYYKLLKARYERQRKAKDFARVAKGLNLWYQRSTQVAGMQEQVLDRTVIPGESCLRLVK